MKRLRAGLAALPEATTALGFGTAWLAPALVSVPFLKTLLATLLLEFLAVHAGGFLRGYAESHGDRKGRFGVAVGALGFAGLYLGFGWMLCLAFGTQWPLLALAMVVGAKVIPLLGAKASDDGDHGMWGISTAAYVMVLVITSIVPMPGPTFDAAMLSALDLESGTSSWSNDPNRPFAAGTIYFGLLAYARYRLTRDYS